MYPVLEHLMLVNNVTKKDVASLLSLSYDCIIKKFNKTNDWKLSECKKIKNKWFSEYTIDALFSEEI